MSEANVITEFPWGTLEDGTAAFFANEHYEGDLKPGDIVQIGFGELLGSFPKNRYSAQWVVVTDTTEVANHDGDAFIGMVLIDGWYCGPKAGTLITFTRNHVVKVCDPKEVSNDIQDTDDWRDEQMLDSARFVVPNDSQMSNDNQVPF